MLSISRVGACGFNNAINFHELYCGPFLGLLLVATQHSSDWFQHPQNLQKDI